LETTYPLHKIRVVLLEGVHEEAADALSREGYDVRLSDAALTGPALIDEAGDAHILGIRSKTQVTKEYLDRADRLWAVGCFCIGTNQIDLPAAAAKGVAVFNAPFANTRSVAEMTIAEIVALHRGLFDCSTQVHAGRWRKSSGGRFEVRGRTLGIVGYGHIGSQVSVLAEAMGMHVIFHDIDFKLPLGNARAVGSLDELLQRADVVTLHVPKTADTHNLLSATRIRSMRKGAFLINNARGDVVDVDALADALRSGRLAGAAVDVFPTEPAGAADDFATPLAGAPNTILTPHIGGSTEEAQRNIGVDVAAKLARYMNNGSTVGAVNVPQVDLPTLNPAWRRILHYHRNVPGVLGHLHSMIADLGVNIHSEHLQSNPEFSYVILDVDDERGDELKAGLASVPATIRVRTLI
jgi:D-3-phosphoglycerate dehydrogenase